MTHKTNKLDIESRERCEQRIMPLQILEQRKKKKDGEECDECHEMTIGGYAIRFDEAQTYTFGTQTYTEVIKRGALNNTDMRRVPLRYNHNDSVIAMARTKNGSLRMTVDDFGLKIEADLLDIQSNRDIFSAIQNGLIDEMSFAFTVRDGGDTWTYSENGVLREIKDIEQLYDVSVVDVAFYEGTSVYERSFEKLEEFQNNIEEKRLFELEKAKLIAKLKY